MPVAWALGHLQGHQQSQEEPHQAVEDLGIPCQAGDTVIMREGGQEGLGKDPAHSESLSALQHDNRAQHPHAHIGP